jgi:hypothetical protein
MNELRSTSTGLASSTLPLTLILVRCDQLVRAPHSHAFTVHGDCKITVQFSHGFFSLNRVIAKTRKVRSRITRVACIFCDSTQHNGDISLKTHSCYIKKTRQTTKIITLLKAIIKYKYNAYSELCLCHYSPLFCCKKFPCSDSHFNL